MNGGTNKAYVTAVRLMIKKGVTYSGISENRCNIHGDEAI